MVQTFAKKKRAFFSFLVVLGCVASCDFSKRAGLRSTLLWKKCISEIITFLKFEFQNLKMVSNLI